MLHGNNLDNYHANIATFFVSGTLLLTVFSFFLVYFIILQRNRRNQYYMETQDLIKAHEVRETKVRIEENERTMTEVSKEVHDSIGQIANIIVMHLHHFETMLTNNEQFSFLQRIFAIANKLARDAKNISHSLSGEYIKKWGLRNMISDDLEHLKVAKEITSEIDVTGENIFIDAEKQLIIYRIAQEALNNILKHSKAKHIHVTLNFYNESFLMSIIDNGVGFDYATAIHGDGTGMINMMGRAKVLDADLNIATTPGKGCVIILSLKYTGKETLSTNAHV